MIEDFKTITEMVKGEPKEIGMEPMVPMSKALDTTRENDQALQLSFVDYPDPTADSSPRFETSAVNVEEVTHPEQLSLF